MAPLEELTASSPFGFRISPITGHLGDFHLGQDFAAGCGTRVYAADTGVVRAAGWHPWGGGNRVEIDHGNGLITTYNHLQAIAVRTGDTVQVGQIIARVGTTGWSTGCHLHFETILHGIHTSPLNWTLLPIHQVDMLADIAMVSYEGKAADAGTALPWAIPVAADNSHTVLHGDNELPAPPPAAQAQPTPTTSATPTATPSPPPPGTATATPSPTGTPTGTPSPTGTPTGTPSPTGTATGTPSPTGTATGTATSTPSPTGTATSTPSPTGTATGTATATPSPTGTATGTQSVTPTPTVTATASATPTASASRTATAPPATRPASPTATTAPVAPTAAVPGATSSPARRSPSES